MALTASFAATQTIGLPSKIYLSDTSTGSDVAITSRRVYLTDAAGNAVVPTGTTTSYILWPYANSTITIDVLEQDMALNVQVDWLNVSNAVLYTSTQTLGFTMYSEMFYYELTQSQTGIPLIIADTNYYQNKMILRCNIDEANQAITYAGDLYAAQSALDRAAYLIANQTLFF
jgi:hypothetical protein